MAVAPASASSGDEIGRAVILPEKTWSVKAELPFFDTRLVVDTCANFVAFSYQIRAASHMTSTTDAASNDHTTPHRNDAEDSMRIDRLVSDASEFEFKKQPSLLGTLGTNSSAPQEKQVEAIDFDSRLEKAAVLQAMVAHAHGYIGPERLITELVPRCKPLRDQLIRTVRPLCVNGAADSVEYEVDLFLGSRLVVCNLDDLMLVDFFTDSSEDVAIFVPGSVLMSARVRRERRWSTMQQLNSPKASHPASGDQKDDAVEQDGVDIELVVQRFETRFWRILSTGLGRAIFGSEREDLVNRFVSSAFTLFKRYDGELQLALNSLMGWLPSWISDSFFIAFMGLTASAAVRQQWQKYAMLCRCVKCLLNSGGRYIFLSTPSSYLPLAHCLPSVGDRGLLRSRRVDLPLNLSPVWPAACLDPSVCVRQVLALWGGAIPGKRGELRFLPGFEPIGPWVLRMTYGCEKLLSLALEVIRLNSIFLDRTYDEYADSFIEELALQMGMDENAYGLAFDPQTIDLRTIPTSFIESAAGHIIDGLLTYKRRRCKNTRSRVQNRISRNIFKKKTFVMQSDEGDHIKRSSMRKASDFDPNQGGVPDAISILAQLHASTPHGLASNPTPHGTYKLRSFVFTNSKSYEKNEWPIGHGGGRIPIHDSPDLLPAALLPSLMSDEDRFNLYRRGPSDGHVNSDGSSVADLGENGSTPTENVVTRRSFGRVSMRMSSTAPEKFVFAEGKFATVLERLMGNDPRGSGKSRSSPSSGARSPSSDAGMAPEEFEEVKEKRRRHTAPAAVDTSDFDFGDPIRNSVLLLAFQNLITKDLMETCRSDGPFRATWRNMYGPEELSYVWKAQFSVGVLLLFAALRAPFSALAKVPLHQLASIGTGSERMLANDRELFPAPKVLLADGLFAAGCTPVFHCMPADDSSRTAPLVAGALHIGVPHIFLEDSEIKSALTFRTQTEDGSKRLWRQGSMLVLVFRAAILESFAINKDWTTSTGWVRPDYWNVFSSICVFRLVFGLELVSLWQKELPEASTVSLESFFPFLQGSEARCKSLSVQMNFSIESNGTQPLLVAPWVSPSLPGSPDFQPSIMSEWPCVHRYPGPNSKPVPLQNFASWLHVLRPGRVVYSSRRSDIGDLYLRLEDAIVIFRFVYSDRPLQPHDLQRLYSNAVGNPEWWGVECVSLIVLCNKLETFVGTFTSEGILALEEGWAITPTQNVLAGSEIIICRSACLERFLGRSKDSAFKHEQEFLMQMEEQCAREAAQIESDAPPKRLPVGSGQRAVRMAREDRLPKPQASQLELSEGALCALLDHVAQQTNDLYKACQHIEAVEAERAENGMQSWLKEKHWQMVEDLAEKTHTEEERKKHSEEAEKRRKAREDEEVAARQRVEELEREKAKLLCLADAVQSLYTGGDDGGNSLGKKRSKDFDSEDYGEDDEAGVRIDRVPSPKRTERRMRWRPPTPHPSRGNKNRPSVWVLASNDERKSKIQEEEIIYPFDFLGLKKRL